MEKFPCDGCAGRHSCRGACARLRKFLREDPECYTRVRSTEWVIPDEYLTGIMDSCQADGTRLTWQEIAGATLGYLDIGQIGCLDDGQKALLSAFYTEGMTYGQIAIRYRVSCSTVKRQLIKTKKLLREVYVNEFVAPSD